MTRDDDLLERATRALRATPPPARGELADAKARLLAAQRALPRPPARNGRARTLRWVLPLAAVLAAGSALAAVPERLERLAAAVATVIAPPRPTAVQRSAPARPRAPAVRALPPQPSSPTPAPIAAPAADVQPAPVEAPPAVAAAKPAPARRRRELGPKPAPEPVPTSSALPTPADAPPQQAQPALQPSADLARYRKAHQLHFQDRDFTLALHAWESYLNTYPTGTFAVEARYNRAICLLRLDRRDEARRALAPFARGEIGNGYRQGEAKKLLEALE